MSCPSDNGTPSPLGLNPPNYNQGQATPSNRPNDANISPEVRGAGFKAPSDFGLPGFSPESRSIMTSYSRSLRGCDQAVLDEFRGLDVWLPDGERKKIPIIWGSQEKAVAIAMSDAIDKSQIRIDRIKLPMLAIAAGDLSFAPERFTYHQNIRWLRDRESRMAYGTEKRFGDTVYGKSRGLPVDKNYTLFAWTRYIEDMNQVVEQIILKFSPIITIEVPGVHWEVILKLDGVSNTLSPEIGDSAIRIVKFEFSFHAETYISRGIVRGKTVFDIYNEIGEGSLENLGGATESRVQASEEDLESLRKDHQGGEES